MNPKAIINLKNLRDNIKYLNSHLDISNLMPIIKANAYGHGYANILKIIKKENIQCVAVATSLELNDVINTNSKLDILPIVWDFYFFPHYLMHSVYPFTDSDEERRSISFNAKIDEGIFNVFGGQ